MLLRYEASVCKGREGTFQILASFLLNTVTDLKELGQWQSERASNCYHLWTFPNKNNKKKTGGTYSLHYALQVLTAINSTQNAKTSQRFISNTYSFTHPPGFVVTVVLSSPICIRIFFH